MLDKGYVDGDEGAPSCVSWLQDVLAYAARGACQGCGDEAEGGACLHGGPRAVGADGQAVGGGQVTSQVGLELELLWR